MKHSAHISAAIEILEEINASFTGKTKRPADGVIGAYFKSRRYIGAKDKGAISTLVYGVLRNKATLEWWLMRSGLAFSARSWVIAQLVLIKETSPGSLDQLFGVDEPHAPAAITPTERAAIAQMFRSPIHPDDMPEAAQLNIPDWIYPMLKEQFDDSLRDEMLAMSVEAPVDLRANLLKAQSRDEVMKALRKEDLENEACPISPVGIRLKKRAAIFASKAFREGLFEVQDEGSQIVALLADAKSGQRVIDFCAGAGGKTLAMAAAMKNKGKILAIDTSKKRLDQTKLRLKRAGVDNVELHTIDSDQDKFLKRHIGTADVVLVDAPCTGVGTWRRNPDLKWRSKESDLHELMALQESILQSASRLVKDGGRLVYATCSILKSENAQQVEKFLGKNPNFRVVAIDFLWNNISSSNQRVESPYLSLSPLRDNTDGFFAAVLEKRPNNEALNIT